MSGGFIQRGIKGKGAGGAPGEREKERIGDKV
jgi:hypothetical protein